MEETYYETDYPFSFAFLSDTHNADPQEILRSLRRNRPDAILFSGDFVRGERSFGSASKMEESRNALELFLRCAEIAPVFTSMGNHERSLTPLDLEMIRETGAVILDNDMTEFRGVLIGGLSSAYFTEYQRQPEKYLFSAKKKRHLPYFLRKAPAPDISWLGKFSGQNRKKILLCHHPEYYHRYLRDLDIGLILSGHCHGGQWRYYSPFGKEWRGVYGPGQGLFPSLTSGMHEGRLVISRGLSNTAPLPRINNPEEIIYFKSVSGI